MALKRTWFVIVKWVTCSLLAAGVLGDGLGALTDSVLSKLTGQKQTNSSLNLPRSDGRSLVVMSQPRSFSSDSFEDVVHEAIHDRHGFSGDSSVGMNLLQHLVDVDSVALLPALLLLLVSLGDVLLGLSGLFRSLSRGFGCHCTRLVNNTMLAY